MLSLVTTMKVGMQKRGIARILQATEQLAEVYWENRDRFLLTKGEYVSHEAHNSKVEAPFLDIFAAAENQ
jgi:hypothetical protein